MSYPIIEVRQPGTTVLWVIIHDRLIIGRDCDGLLLRDDHTSRQHIELKLNSKNIIVTDLNSTNGTLLNGIKLNGSKPFLVDDVIIIGHTEIRLISLHSNALSQQEEQFNVPTSSVTVLADKVVSEKPELSAFQSKEGTVTIVFSDIESSTELAAKLGDQLWLSLLKQHDRLFKQLVSQYHGAIIKSQGDGFMLSFQSVRSALQCVIAIQQAIHSEFSHHTEANIRVRIGLHTGEAIHTLDGDLYGRHVITAARISSQAKGGQILASSLVKQLAHGADIHFGEAIEIPMKGLETTKVHEVIWEQNNHS